MHGDFEPPPEDDGAGCAIEFLVGILAALLLMAAFLAGVS